MKTTQHKGHAVHRLHSGRVLALADPPPTPEGATLAKSIANALNALRAFDDAKAEAAADARLSSLGREEKVAPLREMAIRAVAGAAQALNNYRENVEDDERNLFLPPALDKSDVVGALRDRELRDYARELPLHALMKQLESNEGLAVAILRSPVPEVFGAAVDFARSRYVATVAKTDPRAAELRDAREAWNWAAIAVPRIAEHVADGVDRTQLLQSLAADGNTAIAATFGYGDAAVEENARRSAATAKA